MTPRQHRSQPFEAVPKLDDRPARAAEQLNRINGENTRDLHLGKSGETRFPLTLLHTGHFTAGQAHESATVYLRAGLLRGNAAMVEGGRSRLQSLLDWQAAHGHRTAEKLGGDSQLLVWYRALASARLTGAALRYQSRLLARLDDSLQAWWSRELACCEASLSAAGPADGRTDGNGGFSKAGGDAGREAVFEIATGRKRTAKVGPRALQGLETDTFSVYLAAQIAALPGGFCSNAVRAGCPAPLLGPSAGALGTAI